MLDTKIDTFLTLCHTMNYTKAAKELNITQPAVSQQIKQLEIYYQVKLFKTIGKKLILTPEGSALKDAMSLMKQNEQLIEQNLLKTRNKNFVFGSTLTVGEFMMAKPVANYLTRHPDSKIQMKVNNTKNLVEDLRTGKIDFAVLEGNYNKVEFNTRLYKKVEFIAVSANSDQYPDSATIKQLTKYPLIAREQGSGTRNIMESLLSDNGYTINDFNNVIEIGDMNAIKDMVALNCGITFLYKTAVEEELQNKRIKQIQIPNNIIQHEISIVWSKHLIYDEYDTLFNELFF